MLIRLRPANCRGLRRFTRSGAVIMIEESHMVELNWEEYGVMRRLLGRVTGEELDASAIKLQEHDRIDELRFIIHDFSEATEVLVSQDDIEFMAVRASVALTKNPKVRIAFVGDHPVAKALITAFNEQGISTHRCQLCETLAAARSYVGADA